MTKGQLNKAIKSTKAFNEYQETKTKIPALQLSPEEASKLKYLLEQKLNDWKSSPGFWSEHIVAVKSILEKMK